ncbi:Probable peptidyl-prolyl cis-trans isomerase B [Microbacterium esteraromaticum]|uniref:Peptidyl-prolyl cis-trans isomerase n=1 Tax=Microbacterium esteraromaticum TaxID=57043 RepID=A0A1R4KCX7_9MICO|nr:peptidylprolyl isomerase [Microbacterium esteraromaticum]SJN42271.1 Probable peptidyl-prolyl cis-trans isomerase B [Microbacterium esteraromaticum]
MPSLFESVTRPSRLRRLLLVASIGAALALTGCASTPGSTPAEPAATQPSDAATQPAASGECAYPTANERPSAKPVTAPDADPSLSGEVAATITTSAGDLAVTLDADAAPCTVNSFLSLAEQGYFDGTTCHRLTTEGIFVLQCGDPTATGTGGPGYSFADELDGSETYEAGTLAMANAGPDTNGSQFFVVYADTPLPPAYTVFGHLDEASTKIVADIAAAGTESGAPDGAPKTPVTLESVTAN